MPFQPDYPVPEERQPYTLRASRVGALMLHGFMGSPLSSRPMASYLSQRGVTIHCPLLPGHGSIPEKFYKVSRRAWLAEAEEGLARLRQLADAFFIIGHSMGCVLAAYLAERYADISGIIMLAPTYDVPDRRIRWLRFLRHVMPWFYPHKSRRLQRLVRERVLDFDPAFDFEAPNVVEKLKVMTRVPTSGIDEMRRVLDFGRSLWSRVPVPLLLLHGGRDDVVSPGSAQRIYDQWPASDKQLVLLPQGKHEMMRLFDPVHDEVWDLVYRFIQERTPLPLPA